MATSASLTWAGLVARNLLRRPGRAAFTIIGVALAVASYLALTGLTRGMIAGAQASQEARGIDLVVADRGAADIYAGSLPQDLADIIRRQPGVADVAAELDASLAVGGRVVGGKQGDGGHAIVSGWPADQFPYRELRLKRGRAPRAGEPAVVLGQRLAEEAGVDVGGAIELGFRRFEVVGVSDQNSGFLGRTAIMPIETLQALLSRKDQVTLFQVRLTDAGDGAARERARKAIAALRPNLGVSTTAEAMRSSRLMQMIDSTSLAISIVALAIGCLSVVNTMAMGVEERTREIGILSAIGWSRRRILGLILSEGFILAGVGGLLGVGLGSIGHAALVDSITPGAELSSEVMASQTVRAVAAAFVLGALGALAPAWRASRLAPAAALRRQ